MPSANANSLRGQIRRLIEQNGKLHRHELRALLPGVPRGAGFVPVSGSALGDALRRLVREKILNRDEQDGFTLGRPVLCSGRAGKLGKVAGTPALRAMKVKDYGTRQQMRAEAAQAITRRDLGQRDQPANELPCTESWLAKNAAKPGAFERLASGKVGPSSQFRALENVA
jgi:hypothetical protein